MRFLAIAVIFVLLQASPAQAEWELDVKRSNLTFGSLKNLSVAEVHHFTDLQARVGEDGVFSLHIALAGAETGIEIRNQRMREFLFDLGRFPNVVYCGVLDLEALSKMKRGQIVEVTVAGNLALHGHDQPLGLRLVVTRIAEGRVVVTPGQVITINAGDFGLLEGLEKLRQLAGLKSISPVVPINFRLEFVETP